MATTLYVAGSLPPCAKILSYAHPLLRFSIGAARVVGRNIPTLHEDISPHFPLRAGLAYPQYHNRSSCTRKSSEFSNKLSSIIPPGRSWIPSEEDWALMMPRTMTLSHPIECKYFDEKISGVAPNGFLTHCEPIMCLRAIACPRPKNILLERGRWLENASAIMLRRMDTS